MTERVSCAKCGRCMGVTPINGCRNPALCWATDGHACLVQQILQKDSRIAELENELRRHSSGKGS